MIARTFPDEAKIRAVDIDMSELKAATNATSELNGSIVAAKKAAKNNANSEM